MTIYHEISTIGNCKRKLTIRKRIRGSMKKYNTQRLQKDIHTRLRIFITSIGNLCIRNIEQFILKECLRILRYAKYNSFYNCPYLEYFATSQYLNKHRIFDKFCIRCRKRNIYSCLFISLSQFFLFYRYT